MHKFVWTLVSFCFESTTIQYSLFFPKRPLDWNASVSSPPPMNKVCSHHALYAQDKGLSIEEWSSQRVLTSWGSAGSGCKLVDTPSSEERRTGRDRCPLEILWREIEKWWEQFDGILCPLTQEVWCRMEVRIPRKRSNVQVCSMLPELDGRAPAPSRFWRIGFFDERRVR